MPSISLHRALRVPLLLALLPLALSGCEEAVEAGLVIQGYSSDETRPYFHDFGAVPHGEVVSYTFELLNTDRRDVTIKSVRPACACTVGKVYCKTAEGERIDGNMREKPVLVVPARATAFLEFVLDSRQVPQRNTDKLVLVNLACDSPHTPFINFELHTVVSVPLQATPSPLDLKDVPASAGAFATVQVARADPTNGVEVTGVSSTSAGLGATIEETSILGEDVWAVTIQIEPAAQLGPFRGEVALAVTGEGGVGEGRPFTIPVNARLVEDVIVQPPVLSFGRFEEGFARAEGLLRALIPGDRVKVLASELTSEAEGLSVEVEPVDPDAIGRSDRWKLTVTAPPTLEGQTYTGTVSLELDHPSVPSLDVRFVGRPR